MIQGKIFKSTVVIGTSNLSLGVHSQIDDFCFINAGIRCVIGRNVHLSTFTSIVGGGECLIGDFSGLSAGCRIVTGSDDFTGKCLTNPTVPDKYKNVTLDVVEIGRHVILGTNCVVLPGVKIGDGVAVSAGAIIRKDLLPWTVYAVIRGKLLPIKKRDQKSILMLEERYIDYDK
jgi:galactoside O-acetyltransferase